MKILTKEVAAAFGFRDRILGVDSESRNITLDRFRGRRRLERAYWAAWCEAEAYCADCWKWGAAGAQAPKQIRCPACCLADAA